MFLFASDMQEGNMNSRYPYRCFYYFPRCCYFCLPLYKDNSAPRHRRRHDYYSTKLYYWGMAMSFISFPLFFLFFFNFSACIICQWCYCFSCAAFSFPNKFISFLSNTHKPHALSHSPSKRQLARWLFGRLTACLAACHGVTLESCWIKTISWHAHIYFSTNSVYFLSYPGKSFLAHTQFCFETQCDSPLTRSRSSTLWFADFWLRPPEFRNNEGAQQQMFEMKWAN